MRAFLCFALLCSSTFAAADPAADFEKLRLAMPGLSFASDPETQVTSTRAMIQRLAGRWVILSRLMGETESYPDPDIVARGCEKIANDIQPDGKLSFTITFGNPDARVHVRLQYVGGTTFVSSFPEDEMLGRLLARQADTDDPRKLFSALVVNSQVGYVSLTEVGSDLLLWQSPTRPADLYARCP